MVPTMLYLLQSAFEDAAMLGAPPIAEVPCHIVPCCLFLAAFYKLPSMNCMLP